MSRLLMSEVRRRTIAEMTAEVMKDGPLPTGLLDSSEASRKSCGHGPRVDGCEPCTVAHTLPMRPGPEDISEACPHLSSDDTGSCHECGRRSGEAPIDLLDDAREAIIGLIWTIERDAMWPTEQAYAGLIKAAVATARATLAKLPQRRESARPPSNIDEILRQTDGMPLVDALTHVATWENERAVAQALRGVRDPHTGALWDTCFLYVFRALLLRRRESDQTSGGARKEPLATREGTTPSTPVGEPEEAGTTSTPNASPAREPVVWADDASPFTGPQVKALLDENERLRKPPQLVRYAVWRHREANTPELVAAFRHRDHAEQWAQKMYATSEREAARLDDDASVQGREPRTADSSCPTPAEDIRDADLDRMTARECFEYLSRGLDGGEAAILKAVAMTRAHERRKRATPFTRPAGEEPSR